MKIGSSPVTIQFEEGTPSKPSTLAVIEPTKQTIHSELSSQLITESTQTFKEEVISKLIRETSRQTYRSEQSSVTSISFKVAKTTEITASTKFDSDGIWNIL